MNNKLKNRLFNIIGILGLACLLAVIIFVQHKTQKLEIIPKSSAHDHANPAEHNNDLTSKNIDKGMEHLKLSGRIVKGIRVIDFNAYQYRFSPDPLVVSTGEQVLLSLESHDVVHGMMIPEIDFSAEMPINKKSNVQFKAPDKPGVYPIFCNIYCGTDHGNMKGSLIVLSKNIEESEHLHD